VRVLLQQQQLQQQQVSHGQQPQAEPQGGTDSEMEQLRSTGG
jgi:hypothetical protein